MIRLDVLDRAAKYEVALDAYARAKAESDALRIQVARLQDENRRLRRRLREGSYQMRLLQEAHENALLMVAYAGVGLSISRRDMIARGMSQRKWERARALLWVARIYNGRRLVIDDQETIMRRLEVAVERCAKDDAPLRLRMPKRK